MDLLINFPALSLHLKFRSYPSYLLLLYSPRPCWNTRRCLHTSALHFRAKLLNTTFSEIETFYNLSCLIKVAARHLWLIRHLKHN